MRRESVSGTGWSTSTGTRSSITMIHSPAGTLHDSGTTRSRSKCLSPRGNARVSLSLSGMNRCSISGRKKQHCRVFGPKCGHPKDPRFHWRIVCTWWTRSLVELPAPNTHRSSSQSLLRLPIRRISSDPVESGAIRVGAKKRRPSDSNVSHWVFA